MSDWTFRLQTDSRGAGLLPVAAILGSIVSGMIGATFTRQLFPITGAAGATSLRLCLAALVLCAVWRPWRRRLTRADVHAVLLYGSALAVMNLPFYLSLRTIPLGVAVADEWPLARTVSVRHCERSEASQCRRARS